MVDSTRQLRRRNPINYKEVDSNSSEDEAEFFESSNIVTDNNMAEDLQRQIQSLQEQLAALSSATRHEDTRPNLQKVHIPKFNERNPHLWFAQVERSFALCNITADNDKFDLSNPCEKRLHLYDKSTNSRYLIDSGSAVSVVPPSIIKGKLKPSKLTLLAANQSEIKTFGDCVLKLDLGLQREFKWLFVIADVHTPIIGADFLVNFDLLIDLKQKRLIDKTKLSNDLLKEFEDITKTSTLRKPTDELIVVHHIETTKSPVADRPRRLSGDELKAAKAEMDYLIEQGICRPSKSAKKTGGWRVCGDYRKLNSQTIPDRYPIAHIHGFAENLHDRIDAIKNYKKPETICELRRFIGVINYYRRCIPHAAHQQAPLNELVGNSKKNDKRKVPWTTESENAFEICKRSLCEATMLAHPAPDLELALVTDASDSAIGAVLEQNFNGTWIPLGFYSYFISQFTTDIIYLSGPENTVADAFSRLNEISMPSTVSTEAIQKAQQSDDELKTIINGMVLFYKLSQELNEHVQQRTTLNPTAWLRGGIELLKQR
ncbi:uncharacterized protein [Musca autumnalis]|uniref:uncharacterized protein n=1 Tax=Musca autumnalis TaxID=221902 RepID=UPI003CED60CB